MKYQNDAFTIDLLNEYSFEETDNMLAIYKNNGVGAVHISYYFIPVDYDFQIKNEMFDFIQSIDKCISIPSHLVNCQEAYCTCNFLDGKDNYWSVWVIFSNNKAIFVSYNCDLADMRQENIDIERMVDSIEVL